MICLKCGAMAVPRSDMCHAHGGKPNDWDKECEFGEIHENGEPCRWCDNSEGGY